MKDSARIDLDRIAGHAQYPLDKPALLARARAAGVDAPTLALLARLPDAFPTYTQLSAALWAAAHPRAPRTAGRSSSPSLGNGLEASLDETTAGWGRAEGPESQGGYAGDEYGGTGQGGYGDESYDPSYQRDEREAVEAIDPDAGLSVLADLPADHEGPGRGEGGGEWTGQRPLESPEDIVRRGFDGAVEDRRRDDATIDDDVHDAIAATSEIRGDVTIAVEHGEVTLTGIVPDEASRNAAHRRVAEVPGVTAIVDRIRVGRA